MSTACRALVASFSFPLKCHLDNYWLFYFEEDSVPPGIYFQVLPLGTEKGPAQVTSLAQDSAFLLLHCCPRVLGFRFYPGPHTRGGQFPTDRKYPPCALHATWFYAISNWPCSLTFVLPGYLSDMDKAMNKKNTNHWPLEVFHLGQRGFYFDYIPNNIN